MKRLYAMAEWSGLLDRDGEVCVCENCMRMSRGALMEDGSNVLSGIEVRAC